MAPPRLPPPQVQVEPPSSAVEPSESAFEGLTSFLASHRKTLLITAAAGLAAVAIVGGVYYASSSSSAGSSSGGPFGGLFGANDENGVGAGGARKGKKKKRRSGKGFGSGKKDGSEEEDGPLIKEREKDGDVVELDEPKLTQEEIESLKLEDRVARAATLKSKGNVAYGDKKLAVAVEYYTRAIAMSPRPEAVFYANRAAAYLNMDPPRHEKVVEDCDAALKIDKNYVKALNRRAGVLELLERYPEALRDFTAATILDKFQNASSAQAVERVLKVYSMAEAARILAVREVRLPSNSFTAAYFAAFRPQDPPQVPDPETATVADQQLLKAFEALEAMDYIHAFTLVNESLEGHEPSWAQGQAEAYNLRGTFKFLCGDSNGAKDDFLKSTVLVPSFTQSWVKLASVYMEQGEPPAAFAAFDTAISHNKDDPDIYYHRGQVYFIMNEWTKAMADYNTSTDLDPKFVFSHIQLAVAQYKAGNIANSMATFRKTLKAFPQRSEAFNYYGELLLDQTRFQEAIEKFDRAIELEKKKTRNVNVLPMVNKGLALFQSSQDLAAAAKLCNEALAIDPENEAAVATLAQLSLQQGKIADAVKMFERHCELTRTEPELQNALTYKFASEAQLLFMQNYPEQAAQMSQLAQAMG